jgi:hypothetical protein
MSKDSNSFIAMIQHFLLLGVVFLIFRWFIMGMFGKYWFLFWGYLVVVLVIYFDSKK